MPSRPSTLALAACAAAAVAAPARAVLPPADPPAVPAGSQAAPLWPDEADSSWRLSLAAGLAGKGGGMRIEADRSNPAVLLYFAGQADGAWSRRFGQAARLRFRLFTGGERDIYVPSDGEAEAAYALGRREFRFVVARLEVGRSPALGLDALAQAATLPSFEGSIPLPGDGMRLDYAASPVEASFVRYHGRWHVPDTAAWASESARPVAATAGRLRFTAEVATAVLASVEGEALKMWRQGDLLLGAEAGIGWQALDRTALFSLSLRWNAYMRRGLAPDTTATASEVLLVGAATLGL